MASYNEGKQEVCEWITKHFRAGATCLDVGAGDGKWADMLGDYLVMDGVEIFAPYIDQYGLRNKYRKIYNADIVDFKYDWYDLIIFGDVIEHMTVEQAKRVLRYAHTRCDDLVIAVPFMYKQGEERGNKWERHIQDNLTALSFAVNYPGYHILCRPSWNYAYYTKEK